LENLEVLKKIKCFLVDMDGTIFVEDHLLPGAKAWVDLLEEKGMDYYFLTNNSSRSRLEYAEKLKGLGLEVPEVKIFTSGEATAIYLQKSNSPSSLYVVGTPALVAEFRRHGFTITDVDPDAVVLGFDTTLTYEKLWKLCDFVVAGKPYIATHPDINCPTKDGFKPDIGAMIELVAASTQRRPDVVVGKPNAPIVDALAEKTGLPLEAHCMIGDRLYTDIALGKWGITTALVLSGETKWEDLAASPFKPDFVLSGIFEMVDLFRGILD
jgi:4-nitrophenyl phosphatase/NagD protein